MTTPARTLYLTILEGSSPATPMARERLGTPRPETFCPAPGCGKRFTPSPRLRGYPQKFCSDRCRTADHRARRHAGQDEQRVECRHGRARVVAVAPDDPR